MAWSTRELADLAGTTVNTVRHYHRLGLLAEPERRVNGYKQYGAADLVRLLRIRRLVDLGVPLAQIDAAGDGELTAPDALRAVDAELAATIARLEAARADIAAILEGNAPADAPKGFAAVAARMSAADSAILHVYAQMYDEEALADLRSMMDVAGGQVDQDFDALPADADEATRQRLAEALAPSLAQHLADYPWMSDPAARSSKGEQVTRETFVEAMVELYNPAQLDVLGRASTIVTGQPPAAGAAQRPTDDNGEGPARPGP